MTENGDVAVLDAKFAKFADTSARFSRRVSRDTALVLSLSSSENVERNLWIAKTMFGKWTVDIVSLLYATHSAGFQEIRKGLGDISGRVLSTKLANLESLGLINRQVIDERPPKVKYSLTEVGRRVSRLGEPMFLYLRLVTDKLVPQLATGSSQMGSSRSPPGESEG